MLKVLLDKNSVPSKEYDWNAQSVTSLNRIPYVETPSKISVESGGKMELVEEYEKFDEFEGLEEMIGQYDFKVNKVNR